MPIDPNEVIHSAVVGTLNVLSACAESGTVKRVIMIMIIMIMIRYWKDSTQCWLHPGGGGTLKTKRGLITTNLVQKYNY